MKWKNCCCRVENASFEWRHHLENDGKRYGANIRRKLQYFIYCIILFIVLFYLLHYFIYCIVLFIVLFYLLYYFYLLHYFNHCIILFITIFYLLYYFIFYIILGIIIKN